jgi:hypothetical protein
METERRGVVVTLGMLALVTIIASGCGREDETNPRTASMVATTRTGANARSGPNQAPVVDSLAIHPARPTSGRVVEAHAKASDPDGDVPSVIYRWRSEDGELLGEGRELDTSGMRPGRRIEVVAIANDGVTDSSPAVLGFRLGDSSSDMEISLVAIDASEGTTPGSILRAVVEATNEGSGRFDPELEWRIRDEVVGTDDELATGSFQPGDVVVLRARLGSEHSRSRSVSSAPIRLTRGAAPVIESEPLAGIEGGLFRYQVRARSPEPEASLAFELLQGPEGMQIDARTGVVQWRPAPEQRGRFPIEIAVRDQWGSGVAQSFELVADPPESPPASAR